MNAMPTPAMTRMLEWFAIQTIPCSTRTYGRTLSRGTPSDKAVAKHTPTNTLRACVDHGWLVRDDWEQVAAADVRYRITAKGRQVVEKPDYPKAKPLASKSAM